MRRRATVAALLVGALALGGAACSGDDDNESSGENQVCSAFAQVVSSIEDIQDVNVHDEGTQALLVSVQQLNSTLAQLGREVSDALQPAVEQFQDDLGTVEDTLEEAGDQPTDAQLDQVESEVQTAVESARTAVSSAGDNVPDCNLTLD
jgi:gas vesicle protein